jgi:hypothetical protein
VEDRVASRLQLADPRRAGQEHDLALGKRAVLGHAAVVLEALDRLGRRPRPLVVDGHVAVRVVAERAQVALELTDVVAVAHVRREVPPRRQRAIEQPRRRRIVDVVQRVSAPHDVTGIADRGQRPGHCRPQRRGVGVTQRAAEGLAIDEVAALDRRAGRRRGA